MSDWRDPEIEAELAAERALPTASAAQREALYGRVMQTVAAPAPAPAAGLGGSKLVLVGALLAGVGWLALRGGDEGPPSAPVESAQPSAVDHSAASHSSASHGAAPSQVETPPPSPAAQPAAEPSTAATIVPRRDDPPAAVRPRPASPPPAATLAAEQALLEQARRALAANDSRAALAAIARHGSRFAAGQLAEERELLRVQALVRAGRIDAARRHAAGFRRRFPASLLEEALDVALETPAEAPRRPADGRFEDR